MIVPVAVLYAGLAGVLLALIIATITHGWQIRIFAILALRLGIGWLFLFEGLNKLNSFAVGPSDSNKVFTSEPYFAAAEGPLGDYMRKKYLGDPEGTYTARLSKSKALSAAEFQKLSEADQAALCPDAAAEYLTSSRDRALIQLAEDKATATFEMDEGNREKKAAEELGSNSSAASLIKQAERKIEFATEKLGGIEKLNQKITDLKAEDFLPLKARFAAWVYGAATRPAKVNMVTGDMQLTVEQRLSAVKLLQREYDNLLTRDSETHMGFGYGYEMDRKKKLKADITKAKADLAADTEKFLNELVGEVGVPDPRPAKVKPIQELDHLTAIMITAVGAGLLLGLITKLWSLVGIGFLVMTYLTHPTVPWLPLPPGTEGSPLFINKNLIMALGLLVVLVHPTGRWLGIDALLGRLWSGKSRRTAPKGPTATGPATA